MTNYAIVYSFYGHTKRYGPVRAANVQEAKWIFERMMSGQDIRILEVHSYF